MAVRKILTVKKYEKLLRSKSEPVSKMSREIKALCQDLIDTMGDNPAIGLAAPQIGVLKRVFGVHLGYSEDQEPEDKAPPTIMINPEIAQPEGNERGYDACLSMPGLVGYTQRANAVRVKYLDQNWQKHDEIFTGWDARVILHELDHLNGVLFTDRLASLADLYVVTVDEEGNHHNTPYLDVVKGANDQLSASVNAGRLSSKPAVR